MNHLNGGLIKYLSSAPFHSMPTPILVNHLSLHAPICFRHELFDFLCLVDAETKSWRLARAVSQHADACLSNGGGESICLETREGYSNLEVEDLPGIN